jgi:hypothetical protein
MAVFFGTVAMRMAVKVVPVSMGMRVMSELRGREDFRNPAHDAREIQNSEKNQHKANRELHGETDSRWNYDAEQNDCGADHQNRYGVTEPPENTDQSSLANATLAADDRRDRDDVVRIGSVAHAEEEAESNDGEESDHLFLDRGAAGTCRSQPLIIFRTIAALVPFHHLAVLGTTLRGTAKQQGGKTLSQFWGDGMRKISEGGVLQDLTHRPFSVNLVRAYTRRRVWQCRDQSARIGMSRRMKYAFRRAALYDQPLVENADSMA